MGRKNCKRRVQRYGWDKAVTDYEAGWRTQTGGRRRAACSPMAGAANPASGVLDVACGTGLVTFRAAEFCRRYRRGGRHRHLRRNGRKPRAKSPAKKGITNTSFERLGRGSFGTQWRTVSTRAFMRPSA